MAFQHGALLKEQTPNGVAVGAAKMVERTVRNSVGDRPRIARMATKFNHKCYTDQLWLAAGRIRTVDPTYLDGVYGAAEGSGISRAQILRGLLAPEVLFVLSADESGPKLKAAAWDSYRKTNRILRYRLKPKSLRILFLFADMLDY